MGVNVINAGILRRPTIDEGVTRNERYDPLGFGVVEAHHGFTSAPPAPFAIWPRSVKNEIFLILRTKDMPYTCAAFDRRVADHLTFAAVQRIASNHLVVTVIYALPVRRPPFMGCIIVDRREHLSAAVASMGARRVESTAYFIPL